MPTPKHIVMTVFGSLGDLHPLMALGIELQARGHRVTLAASRMYQEKIEREGLGFSLLRPDQGDFDAAVYDEIFDPRTGPERLMKKYLLPYVRDSYEDLHPLLKQADFLVNSPIVYAGPILAESLQLPWAAVALQPYLFFSAYDPPTLSPLPITEHWHGWGPGFWKVFLHLVKSTANHWPQQVYQLRRELGLPSRGNPIFEGQFSPYLNLALFSPQIGPPQPDWPSNTLTPGFVFYDRMHPETQILPENIQRFLAQGEPPLVFTLGSSVVKTTTQFYEISMQAAQALNRRAIFVAGDIPAPAHGLTEQMFWSNAVPYSALFPHAAAIVHQGGMGTTAQAMRAGKPMLVVPHGFDQPDNAARVKRLGLSRTIYPKQYTASRIVQELNHLLGDPAYTQAAQRMGELIQAEDGLNLACRHIKALL